MRHLFLTMFLLLVAIPQGRAEEFLTIGSKAPPLDIAHWVTNRDGELGQVKEFEAGNIYVVEFWATWCGPCVASMPHLASLQDKYVDQKVQIISVSDEELKDVEEFLQKKQRGGDGSKIYADICKQYCLTTDPDESVYKDYMYAAKQNGIPTAFIVGKTSQIEWIGHPRALDKPLDAVINDSWDRAAFAKEVIAKQRFAVMEEKIYELLEAEKVDESLKFLDSCLKEVSPEQVEYLLTTRLGILLSKRPQQAADEMPTLLKEADANRFIEYVAQVAYSKMRKHTELKEKIVDLCVQHSETALEKAEDATDKVYILDAVAHSLASINRFEEALEMEQAALANAEEKMKSAVLRRLKRIERSRDKAKERAEQAKADKQETAPPAPQS